MKFLYALVLPLAVALAGCDMSVGHLTGRATDEGTHRYTPALGGKVMARTTNGAVTGKGLSGGVEARSTNGMVNIDFASVGRDPISAKTTNGGVSISLPQNAKADLSATWTNGGVNVSPDLRVEVTEKSRRRFEGRMNGGGTPVELHTTNRCIRVRTRNQDAEDPNADPRTPILEPRLKPERERGQSH